jgi:hypothetical protein
MAHVIQLALGAFMSSLGVNGRTKSISNNYSFRLKHPGVLDGSDGSGGTSYPLTKNYTLPVAQATGRVAEHLGAPATNLGASGSTSNHSRAFWEKHLWERCWCAWNS